MGTLEELEWTMKSMAKRNLESELASGGLLGWIVLVALAGSVALCLGCHSRQRTGVDERVDVSVLPVFSYRGMSGIPLQRQIRGREPILGTAPLGVLSEEWLGEFRETAGKLMRCPDRNRVAASVVFGQPDYPEMAASEFFELLEDVTIDIMLNDTSLYYTDAAMRDLDVMTTSLLEYNEASGRRSYATNERDRAALEGVWLDDDIERRYNILSSNACSVLVYNACDRIGFVDRTELFGALLFNQDDQLIAVFDIWIVWERASLDRKGR
jgi:hypothetical protein